MATLRVMESTREQLLHLLQTKGEATVADLSDALGVGPAAVRRHLDHLRVEGLADVRIERHGVGRPSFVFYPTAEAEERTPAGYSRLLSRVYRELSTLDEESLSGKDGKQVLRVLMDGVAHQVAREQMAFVTGSDVASRVQQVTEALRPEGIVDDWTKSGDEYRLTNTACPYRQAAAGTHGPCELDRKTIELLVSVPVRQVSRIVDGHSTCEYVISAARKLQEG
jgi:predicted ArsR family transcriptional regulator